MNPSCRLLLIAGMVILVAAGALLVANSMSTSDEKEPLVYQPRHPIETSGFLAVYDNLPPWGNDATLDDYAVVHRQHVSRCLAALDEMIELETQPLKNLLMSKAVLLQSRGEPIEAYKVLKELEAKVRGSELEADVLYTIIFYQGLTALRIGENDNCVMCRGESSCIFPISPAAIHTNPAGARQAQVHFSEYLRVFPDDLEVKWLLNLCHMLLGEHPSKVDPRHLLVFDNYCKKSEYDVGQFRDVGHRVGLNRLNESGGAIMEDFDNDGLLDLVVTDWAPTGVMAFYRNKGDGTFEERTLEAGLNGQMGGLYCVQTDYNNDGHMDIFIPRGAWLPAHLAMRSSLLRNNGNGTFTDVTIQAGLQFPYNSNTAIWADYDNDGFLDVFICGQFRQCGLYRNKGDGTFEEVAARAGLPSDLIASLGAVWVDLDNDGYPELFVNTAKVHGTPADALSRLYRNNRNGTFTDVTKEWGVNGPVTGFSSWAWDFDNDGWLDVFATTREHTLEAIVRGMLDQPHDQPTPRLYRNRGGKGFQDLTKEAGLDKCYSPMGSNFGDIDNDGYLDFYLGTGDPDLGTLIPNRLFKNIAGNRFVEITASSRTGHLQKGHGIALGDWDRNGTLDIFHQMGGAVKGDQYHNILFKNPGQGNNWLSVKLIGAMGPGDPPQKSGVKKTNRAALGARIKVVTAGRHPLTVHRHVSSGSSFGANPLEQHIGLGKADRVALLEIYWPTSGTTQTFRDIDVNQGIVISEFAKDYQKRSWKPLSLPE